MEILANFELFQTLIVASFVMHSGIISACFIKVLFRFFQCVLSSDFDRVSIKIFTRLNEIVYCWKMKLVSVEKQYVIFRGKITNEAETYCTLSILTGHLV